VGAIASASRRRGVRVGGIALLVVALALVGAQGARADPGSGNGSAAAAPDAVPGPGASESTPAAENRSDAPGQAKKAVDGAATIDQAADASAAAGQEEVDNTHVTVRVDEPGDGAPVGQANEASASADASAAAAVDTDAPASVEQHADTEATASQQGVSNTAVSVRVGSAGDDAGVTQANVAAGAATSDAAGGGGPGPGGAARATAVQADASNTSVVVRVFSPGDDGPVSQRNDASAVASADDADATALQDGVRNTSVTIRVESPGASAGVTQQSRATADSGATGGAGTAATTGDADTALVVTVAGSGLERPGPAGLVVWEWTWSWQRDETDDLVVPDAAALASWDWAWGVANDGTTPSRGTVTTRTAAVGETGLQSGSWQWTWQWARDGLPGWSWEWNRSETLPCGSCIWIWSWAWDWVGRPADDASAAPTTAADADAAAAGQLNAARATAEAGVTADVTQTALQEGRGAGAQSAGQLVAIVQDAAAVAAAAQRDVHSVARGLLPPDQQNVVETDASVALAASASQETGQSLWTTGSVAAEQWSGQEADVAQIGSATASGSQTGSVLTGQGAHRARGRVEAGGTASVVQRIDQAAVVDAGSLDQWAGQLALVEQAVGAGASVAQSGTRPSGQAGGTATAASAASDLAVVEQAADQAAARGGGTASQTVMQRAFAGQVGDALATTVQAAGSPGAPVAASDAGVSNRAAIAQSASQATSGESGQDVQEALQDSIVVQRGTAVSTSVGGIAGQALVSNCAALGQGAGQSVGAGAAALAPTDLVSFCLPASSPSPAPSPDARSSASGEGAPVVVSEPIAVAPAPAAPGDDDLLMPHGGPRFVAAPGHRPRSHPAAAGARVAPHAVATGPGLHPVDQLSAPRPTQARLDTRPGSNAGAGDAGREPPLPPAGDPPTWVSALAAAASGAGPSGIAAILLAFALVAPLLLRAREGSVVRRPIDVLVPIDVPV
jgi:hypothetical protein